MHFYLGWLTHFPKIFRQVHCSLFAQTIRAKFLNEVLLRPWFSKFFLSVPINSKPHLDTQVGQNEIDLDSHLCTNVHIK